MKINDVQAAIWATEFLLQDRENWTRCAFARNGRNIPVDILDEDAVCWCQEGAAALSGLGFIDHRATRPARQAAASVILGWAFPNAAITEDPSVVLNDSELFDHADVLKMLAIAFELAAT